MNIKTNNNFGIQCSFSCQCEELVSQFTPVLCRPIGNQI